MSATIVDQDNVGEHLLQHQQVPAQQNDVCSICDTKDDHQKWLHYNQLIDSRKISKDYVHDGSKLELSIYNLEDTDWRIVLEQVNNKEHPLRELQLNWRDDSSEVIEPGFIELLKAIEEHTTLIKFKLRFGYTLKNKGSCVLLEAIRNNQSIKHIWLKSESWDLETAHAFRHMLTNKRTLLSLNISALTESDENHAPDDPTEFQSIAEFAPCVQTTVLESLQITKITYAGLEVLLQSLPTTLVRLDLSENYFYTDMPIPLSYIESNGRNLEILILNSTVATDYFQQQESSSLSTVKTISFGSWIADLFRNQDFLNIVPHNMEDSDWSMLFMELAKDDTISREIHLSLADKFDRNYLSYFETLLGKQCRSTSLEITDSLLDSSIQTELFLQLKENTSITDLRLNFEMDSHSFHELLNLLTIKNNIIRLDLSQIWNISDEEAIMLVNTLKSNTVLQSLELRFSQIGDIGFQALLFSLPNSLSQLRVVDSLISEKSLPSLLTFIKGHPILKEFSLQTNGLNSSSSTEINAPELVGKILTIANANHCICKLDIDEMIKQKMAELTDDVINLRYAELRDYHILELCNQTKKELNRNWSLDLSNNDRISLVGYHHLADILSSTMTIVELSLTDNKMNEAARTRLFNGLRNNKTLRKFCIKKNELNNQDIECVGHFIQNNPTLKEINLSDYRIDDDGAIHLTEVLPESSLEELNLGSNLIGDRGYASLLSSIPPTLKELYLCNNQITESSLETTVTFLLTNRTLTKLGMSSNPIFGEKIWEGEDNACWQQASQASKQNNICELI